MIYVYLFYGLAFIALGLVMALQARSHVRVLMVDSLWMLAAFGFLHGTHEWLAMAIMLEGDVLEGEALALAQSGNVVLNAISFAFLMQFGIQLASLLNQWPAWCRWIPTSLVLVVMLTAIAPPVGAFGTPEWPAAADTLFRYALGFPAPLLAAYCLVMVSKEARKVGAGRLEACLVGSAATFAVYSLFSGLIVPKAPFFPASMVNTETFLVFTNIPVEVFRGICAVLVGGFLAEAFVVETERRRSDFERLREEFIAVIAHDLRSPITTINLSVGLLDRVPSGGPIAERERAMIANIRASARSLNRMVDDLVDASRIEAKRLTLKKEKVDLRRLVYDVIERAAGLTQGHNVKVNIPEATPAIEADPGRVEQILANLLSNAAKYSYPDSDIVVEAAAMPLEMVISVTNYGPGIAPEEISRLFTRFYRTREAVGARAGLGLGLYIAKGLVEVHGGRVWAESEIGKHTTFYFTLPLV